MSGPATVVLHAVAEGANTVDAIAVATGLPTALVRLVTDELRRSGELAIDRVTSGCGDGCGSCDSTGSCATSPDGGSTGLTIGPTRR